MKSDDIDKELMEKARSFALTLKGKAMRRR